MSVLNRFASQVVLTLSLFAGVYSFTSARVVCAEEKPFDPLPLLSEAPPDAPKIAQLLAETFLTPDQWQDEVKKIRERYVDWEKDTQGDMSRYLNDRLVVVALGAANGKVDRIQRGILWLAFYKEFNQDTPGIVSKFMNEHQHSLSRLFTNFTWEKASLYVKNKEWRKDIEERKKAASVEIESGSEAVTALNTK